MKALLFAGAALLVSGCGESGASSREPRWDACELLSPGAVELYGTALAAPLDGGLTQVTGASDFSWPSQMADAGPLRVAQSRCAYRVGGQDDPNGWTIALAARLSESDDVSAADIKELLANEGYSPTVDLPPFTCADQAFQATLQSVAGPPTRRLELHLLVSRPSKHPQSACGVTEGEPLLPLHAYAVLFATNAPTSDPVADRAALVVMGEAVSKNIVDTMARIERFEHPPPDAGSSDDGDADAAPSDDGPTGDAAPPTSVAITDFPSQVADAWCGRIYECCSPDERLGGTLAGGSSSECRFQVATALAVTLAAADDEADAGRVTYDPAAAAACLGDLRTRACTTLTSRVAELPCADALRPVVSAGAPCGSDLDCVDGFCGAATDAGPGPGASGLCVAHAAVGSPCEGNRECGTGACVAGLCGDPAPRPWCQGL